MKRTSLTLVAGMALIALGSCKKEHCDPLPALPASRTIEYHLYTRENFSDDKHEITFRIYMRSNHGYSTVLFDSAIQTMLVSQIPDQAHQLIFRKTVPARFEADTLTAGFIYEMKNVGVSWFLDTVGPRTALKTIDYSFR